MTTLDGATSRNEGRVHAATLSIELIDLAAKAQQSDCSPNFGHGVHALPGGRLLVTPRAQGDSRYPFVHDGMNFWVYGSGYMHANDGLFALFPRRTEGQEPGIAFMAATPGKSGWQPFSLLGVPHTPEDDADPAERFAVFAPSSATYVTRKGGLSFMVCVFPRSANEIVFSVYAQNDRATDAEMLLSTFFNPMLRHQIHETDEDRWFREVRINQRVDGGCAFLFHVNEDKDRHTSLAQYAVIERQCANRRDAQVLATEATPSRSQYMGGMARSLANALPLRRGMFGAEKSLCTFVEPAVAGDMTRLLIAAGGSIRYDYTLRVTESAEKAEHWYQSGCVPVAVEQAIEEQERIEYLHASAMTVKAEESQRNDLDAAVFTEFFAHLMKQVEFCSLIRGYVQLSENSLIGIRDVFQALEALTYWRPDAARTKMLEALTFTLEDGRCLRQYSLPNRNGEPGRADVRPFIDQGVWVISAIATYVRVTGNTGFLHEICGYHRLASEDGARVVKSSQSDTVLDHCRRIRDYMLRQIDPRTGCLRALYGDWNDALDGLGILPGGGDGYGSGVSVMASLQLLQNIGEMREMLRAAGAAETTADTERLNSEEERLSASLWCHAVERAPGGAMRIVHGWGHEGAYHVGSFRDADGVARDSVTSNAFWVLCGMMWRHPETAEHVLAAFDRLDSKYGLRTFQPEFPANEGRFGRIGKLPPGTAENAGTYVHATAFGIMALFEMGEAKRAWDQLVKVLPFTPRHTNLSHSPFVMPNSYGNNPTLGIDGQNMNDWQTGSSNVVLKTILQHAIGFRMEWDELVLRPANWCPFLRWEVAVCARGRRFEIHYENQRQGIRSFEVNGAPQHMHHDPITKAHGIRLVPEDYTEGAIIAIRIVD